MIILNDAMFKKSRSCFIVLFKLSALGVQERTDRFTELKPKFSVNNQLANFIGIPFKMMLKYHYMKEE